jgi:hypothetical protein
LRTDATVVRQPADGACLFHSLAHGLQTPGVNATTLRARVAAWVQVTVTGGGVVCSVLIGRAAKSLEANAVPARSGRASLIFYTFLRPPTPSPKRRTQIRSSRGIR